MISLNLQIPDRSASSSTSQWINSLITIPLGLALIFLASFSASSEAKSCQLVLSDGQRVTVEEDVISGLLDQVQRTYENISAVQYQLAWPDRIDDWPLVGSKEAFMPEVHFFPSPTEEDLAALVDSGTLALAFETKPPISPIKGQQREYLYNNLDDPNHILVRVDVKMAAAGTGPIPAFSAFFVFRRDAHSRALDGFYAIGNSSYRYWTERNHRAELEGTFVIPD